MGLYDRDYMREKRPSGDYEREGNKGFRFPSWVVVVAVILLVAFLMRAC